MSIPDLKYGGAEEPALPGAIIPPGVTTIAIHVRTWGPAKILLWEGQIYTSRHFVPEPGRRSYCGELISPYAKDVTKDGIIDCARCCRYMMKPQWRGAIM